MFYLQSKCHENPEKIFNIRFLSDVIVFISGFVTLNFVLMVLGYRYIVYIMFDILAAFKHIIPLLC